MVTDGSPPTQLAPYMGEQGDVSLLNLWSALICQQSTALSAVKVTANKVMAWRGRVISGFDASNEAAAKLASSTGTPTAADAAS